MKSILSLTLLACLLCIAHSWHMPGRHPTPTAEESDLCTLHGKYSTKLCWISQKDGVEESRTWYGKKRRSVDCSCFGEGGEEAAEDVAKEIGRAIKGDVHSFGGMIRYWRIVGKGQTWEVSGSSPMNPYSG